MGYRCGSDYCIREAAILCCSCWIITKTELPSKVQLGSFEEGHSLNQRCCVAVKLSVGAWEFPRLNGDGTRWWLVIEFVLSHSHISGGSLASVGKVRIRSL